MVTGSLPPMGISPNSAFTAEQMARAYGRRPSVVHPFADVSRLGGARRPEL